jgi:hypothetical protein
LVEQGTPGTTFGRVAEAYARTRPPYPRAAVELGLGADATVLDPEGPEPFIEHARISGRDLVDLHLTGSTPASLSDAERLEIAKRAYPLMDDEYDLRVVAELYWKRFA